MEGRGRGQGEGEGGGRGMALLRESEHGGIKLSLGRVLGAEEDPRRDCFRFLLTKIIIGEDNNEKVNK